MRGVSGPKNIVVGWVIFTVPRRKRVSHAVTVESERAKTETVIEIGSVICSAGCQEKKRSFKDIDGIMIEKLAEGVGFEPTEPLTVRSISSRVPSTKLSHPSIRESQGILWAAFRPRQGKMSLGAHGKRSMVIGNCCCFPFSMMTTTLAFPV